MSSKAASAPTALRHPSCCWRAAALCCPARASPASTHSSRHWPRVNQICWHHSACWCAPCALRTMRPTPQPCASGLALRRRRFGAHTAPRPPRLRDRPPHTRIAPENANSLHVGRRRARHEAVQLLQAVAQLDVLAVEPGVLRNRLLPLLRQILGAEVQRRFSSVS